jgi:CubicO group peptidase (beta-lactamase class C family)
MIRRHFLTSAAAVAVLATVLSIGGAAGAGQEPLSLEARVDQVFARWTGETPGCAVGVAKDGTPVLQKAYGMADLEHDVPNRPDTIFEAGSVSKQFTAAAVVLLARDGKLSLDDPIRKYIPEVPGYEWPITIRQMLMHMSGLRDWGAVSSIGGWPRTTRTYTHDHVLDIISRQKALNFIPGAQYSYSNSGYNLAVVLVDRVSGQSFADFSQERIFKPLGMTSTSWRDDYTRVVKRRATAYADRGGAFAQNMPFENVYGNGGLLTTVVDLLKWNENFVRPVVGDAEFVKIQQEPGAFNDGRMGTYAMGLRVGQHRGVRNINHSGSTAGYRAHLNRFPDQHVSVAVLCNVSSGNATQLANAVSDIYLGSAAQATMTAGAAADAGQGGGRGGGRGGAPVATYTPTADRLASYAGTYTSDEAETVFTVAVEGDALVLRRRPASRIVLRPTTEDAFQAGGLGTIRFYRTEGQVTELSVSQDRVFDLRFDRAPTPPGTR